MAVLAAATALARAAVALVDGAAAVARVAQSAGGAAGAD
jgi:hypothetical protein